MSRATLALVLACAVACADAFAAVQPARLPCARSVAPRAAATSMLAPVPLDAAASLPSTLLLSDTLDALQGFVGSPLILLIPIGAGSLVAAGIIWVLVKSAG